MWAPWRGSQRSSAANVRCTCMCSAHRELITMSSLRSHPHIQACAHIDTWLGSWVSVIAHGYHCTWVPSQRMYMQVNARHVQQLGQGASAAAQGRAIHAVRGVRHIQLPQAAAHALLPPPPLRPALASATLSGHSALSRAMALPVANMHRSAVASSALGRRAGPAPRPALHAMGGRCTRSPASAQPLLPALLSCCNGTWRSCVCAEQAPAAVCCMPALSGPVACGACGAAARLAAAAVSGPPAAAWSLPLPPPSLPSMAGWDVGLRKGLRLALASGAAAALLVPWSLSSSASRTPPGGWCCISQGWCSSCFAGARCAGSFWRQATMKLRNPEEKLLGNCGGGCTTVAQQKGGRERQGGKLAGACTQAAVSGLTNAAEFMAALATLACTCACLAQHAP